MQTKIEMRLEREEGREGKAKGGEAKGELYLEEAAQTHKTH